MRDASGYPAGRNSGTGLFAAIQAFLSTELNAGGSHSCSQAALASSCAPFGLSSSLIFGVQRGLDILAMMGRISGACAQRAPREPAARSSQAPARP